MKGKLTVVLLWALFLLLLAGLLIPVKSGLDDGGTNVYGAVLYTVERRHTMRGDVKGYIEGTAVEVLGGTVYDDTLRKTGVFGDTDAITAVSFSTEDGMGPYEVSADDFNEIRDWLRSFRFLKTAEDGKKLPGMEYFGLTLTYEDGMSYTGPLGVMRMDGEYYYIWGDPIPDAFFGTFGIDTEE